MHVCQIMLVEADTVEEAFDKVESALSDAPEWSDWHNGSGAHTKNFAGRWSGVVFGTPNEKGVYNADEAPNYLQYSDEPALAENVISNYLEQRFNDIRIYKTRAIDLATVSYNPYKAEFDTGIWYVKKLAQLLGDDWTPDSAIYDLEAYTANLEYFIERVKTSPEKQWLIPIDFHF